MQTKGRGISLAKRKRILSAYNRYSRPLEKKMENKLLEIFKNQSKTIENAYRKHVRESKQNKPLVPKKEAEKITDEMIDVFIDWGKLQGDMFMEVFPAYINAGEVGNDLFNILFVDKKDKKTLFNIIREDYIEWANTKGGSQIKKVTDTTKNIVRREISEGIRQGLNTNKIADSISAQIKGIGKSRATTIANTEIHNSIMNGQHMTAKAAGMRKKRWITARDERVRGQKPKDIANHIKLDNEVVDIDAKFSNGLDFPGDTTGPASEVVNCRCSMAYQ